MNLHPAARPNWRTWALAAALAVVAACASLMSPALRQQWLISLVRQPAPYTALAFTSPANLPVTAVAGQDMSLAFTISNHQGQPIRYRYVLASGSTTTLTRLRTGSKLVRAGQEWTVKTAFAPKCRTRECRIQVSLPGQHEHIDLLVTRAHERH
jgi:hypothetical protein